MDLREWKQRLRAIDREFYADLEQTAGCGPFDGGCVVVAEALQTAIGGDVVVLVDAVDGTALHAAVFMDGKLWDYAGPMSPTRFINRFARDELQHTRWTCTSYRPMLEGDLDEACRDDDLRDRLASLFREMLPEADPQVRPRP